ncbi:MAG: hypothetical protein WCH34_10155 [Bacteroidota bacterium]
MKKYTFIFLAFIAFSMPIISQQKKKVVKSEIDRLADKYKKESIITIYSGSDVLECNVSVNYNSDNKPEEIAISGSNKDIKLIAEILSNIVAQKIKSGYKPCQTLESFYSLKDEIVNNLGDFGTKQKIAENVFEKKVKYKFQKMNMIFEIYVSILEFGYFDSNPNKSYYFGISTIDNRRVGGHKASKLDI